MLQQRKTMNTMNTMNSWPSCNVLVMHHMTVCSVTGTAQNIRGAGAAGQVSNHDPWMFGQYLTKGYSKFLLWHLFIFPCWRHDASQICRPLIVQFLGCSWPTSRWHHLGVRASGHELQKCQLHGTKKANILTQAAFHCTELSACLFECLHSCRHVQELILAASGPHWQEQCLHGKVMGEYGGGLGCT